METPPLRRILFVDDDRDIQLVVTMALEAVGGFSVAACSSGVEALERFPEIDPDLVLLDVMMPGMDGLETLESLRKLPNGATVPVLFMTARVQTSEMAAYRELGVVDVIAKPFNPMTLVDSILATWRRVHAPG